MTLIERLRSGEPYDSLVKEAVADRLEQAEKLIGELVECLENHQGNYKLTKSECVPINKALASAKAWKEGT